MTEILGTVSAVLTIAEVSVKTSSHLYELFRSIKDAPQEVMVLGRDIKSFEMIVRNLRISLSSPDVERVVKEDSELAEALDHLQGPMKNCYQSCDYIQKKLHGSGVEHSEETQNNRINIGSVKWHFKRKDVYELISRFQLTKGMFSDAMGALNLLLAFKLSIMMSQNRATNYEAASGKAENDSNGTTVNSCVNFKFDDDVGSKIVQYTKELWDVHPSPEEISPPTRPKKSCDPKDANEILTAVRNNCLKILRSALREIDANIRDPRTGRSALSVAAETGNLSITELLLKNGADVNSHQFSRSGTPQGATYQQEAIVTGGRTPLHWAIANKHVKIANLLLQYGANPNSRNTAGRTVLQEACYTNHSESAELLLQWGADVNGISSHSGWTPVHEAAHGRSVQLLRTLLRYNPLLDIPVPDPYIPGATPVHFVVRSRQQSLLRDLLSKGADPNASMGEDITALHMASAGGWDDGIEILLEKGALINARDQYLLETPLHKAARNIKAGAIELLCARGADMEMKNVDGMNYQEVLNFAQQNPQDWCIKPERASFCTFYSFTR